MSKYLEESYNEALKENVELIEKNKKLLSKLEIAEKALEKVINEADDHKVEPWERMKEMEKYAIEALQQLRS